MLIKPEQLGSALKRGLAPIYWLTGDEPLQLNEAADAIRSAASNAGFQERELLTTDANDFSWSAVQTSLSAYSLFSDKKIIDLRLTNAQLDAQGVELITKYCQKPSSETVLLITSGKLAKDATKLAWYKAVESIGVIVSVWPIDNKSLKPWLKQRLLERSLTLDEQGLDILAMRVEGNLLAAAQEVDKLYGYYGTGFINASQVDNAVGNNAKFDVYKLIDTVLSANVPKVFRILAALKAEGIATAIILWALTREARLLAKLKSALALGQSLDSVYKQLQVWDNRKPLLNQALTRLNQSDLSRIFTYSAKADRQIKGQESGDAWETLLTLCLLFSSAPVLLEPDSYNSKNR